MLHRNELGIVDSVFCGNVGVGELVREAWRLEI